MYKNLCDGVILNEIAGINCRSTNFKVLNFQSRVPGSKPQGGSKVKSAFHPSEVDEMSTRNSWGLGGKLLRSIDKKGP